MPGGQHLRPDEEIDGAADVGVTLHPLAGLIVAHLIAVDDLVGRLAEDIDVLIADLLTDLDVRTVHRAKRQRTVEHELHVAGAGRLLGGQRDLLRQVAGGDELLRPGDVVVLHHVHLHPGAHLGVVGNQIL